MTTIPLEQVIDAHKLTADGEIDLFVLTASGGGSTLYFKNDNDVTWQGNTYYGVPLKFSGENTAVQGGSPQPRLAIGQEGVNLSMFKPLVFDGSLDGALITRTHILVDDMVNNRLIRTQYFYRVRRVESYSRSSIGLQLASKSDSLGFSMPFRSYTPPAFPAVLM